MSVSASFLSACGGGSGDGGAVPPPPAACGTWPAVTELASPGGHGAALTLAILGPCDVLVGGYRASGTLGQSVGDSQGFVTRLSLQAGGTVVAAWTYVLDSDGSDSVLRLVRDGDGIVFLGDVGGTLPGQVSAGKRDVVVGRLDRNGRVSGVTQLGTSRPNTPLAWLVAPSGEVLLVGNDDVHVPTNFVERWEDPWLAGLTEQGGQMTVDWWQNADTPVSDAVAAALLVDYTALLASHRREGANAGIGVEARSLTGDVLWQRRLSPHRHDVIADLQPDGDGGVLVLGSTYASLAGPSRGGADYFLQRLDPAQGEVTPVGQFGDEQLNWARRLLVEADRWLVLGERSEGVYPWALELLLLAADGSVLRHVEKNYGASTSAFDVALVEGGALVVGAVERTGGRGSAYLAFVPL